jgi:hypothetical protein
LGTRFWEGLGAAARRFWVAGVAAYDWSDCEVWEVKRLLVLLICAGASAQPAANVTPAPATSVAASAPSEIGILQVDRDAVLNELKIDVGEYTIHRLDCTTGEITKSYDAGDTIDHFSKTKQYGGTVGGHCRALLETSAEFNTNKGKFTYGTERVDMDLLAPYRALIENSPIQFTRTADPSAKLILQRLNDVALDPSNVKATKLDVKIPTNKEPLAIALTPGMAFDVGFTKAVLDYTQNSAAQLPSYVVTGWTDLKLTRAEEACVRNFVPASKTEIPLGTCVQFGHDAAVEYLNSHPQKQSPAPVPPAQH